MARPPNVLRSIKLTLCLPEDLYAKLSVHLYSAAEGRVPKGAYQKFFSDRINEYFQPRSDHGPFT